MPNDINDLSLMSEPVEVDGSITGEDFFQPPIPDDGDHLARLTLGDRGIKASRQKDKSTGQKSGKGFLMVHLAVELLDDSGNKVGVIFDNPTSIVMESVNTSKLHAILDACGNPAPARATLGELLAHTEATLAQSPQVEVTTQWEARYNKGTDTDPDYKTLLKGQKKFPPKPDGGYERIVMDPETGERVTAQAVIRKYKRAS